MPAPRWCGAPRNATPDPARELNLGVLRRLAAKLGASSLAAGYCLLLRHIRRVSGIDLLPHALNQQSSWYAYTHKSRVIVLIAQSDRKPQASSDHRARPSNPDRLFAGGGDIFRAGRLQQIFPVVDFIGSVAMRG
jgi:hypothetical protein